MSKQLSAEARARAQRALALGLKDDDRDPWIREDLAHDILALADALEAAERRLAYCEKRHHEQRKFIDGLQAELEAAVWREGELREALQEVAVSYGVECSHAHGVECRGNNVLREKVRAALRASENK